MNMQELGRTLSRRRARMRMSLEDVARGAGCSRQNVHKVEHALSNPTVATLRRIAGALGMELRFRLVPLGEQEPLPAGPRARLLQRFEHLLDALPDRRLHEAAALLDRLEAHLLEPDGIEEERRTRELERLLRAARIPPDVARRRARSEPDKPADWSRQRERLHRIIRSCHRDLRRSERPPGGQRHAP